MIVQLPVFFKRRRNNRSATEYNFYNYEICEIVIICIKQL